MFNVGIHEINHDGLKVVSPVRGYAVIEIQSMPFLRMIDTQCCRPARFSKISCDSSTANGIEQTAKFGRMNFLAVPNVVDVPAVRDMVSIRCLMITRSGRVVDYGQHGSCFLSGVVDSGDTVIAPEFLVRGASVAEINAARAQA